ncbi:MAG: ion transporter [Proteobacteria bacterium]|nr:ion transporter [Pseudomonadota bacterium]
MIDGARSFAVAPGATVRRLVESRAFNLTVTAVIVVNAVTLGLETWPAAMAAAGPLLLAIDTAALWVFTIEIALKLWVYRGGFFRQGWNLFDFAIVAIAWLPSAGPLSVLRALRIVRVLRLISVIPQMRAVVGALFRALPGMGSILAVLLLVFYVAAVMATKLFGGDFPEWFGSIGASMYSLFQIMTLESWSMGIVRPVMERYPEAWAFFVPFIVVTTFTVLNLFIALIVNSMQTLQARADENLRAEAEIAHDERALLLERIDALTGEVRDLRRSLAKG